MDKVFVIIVTYNGKQWYDSCFGSLRLSEIPVNTIVFDNASSDDTVSYIKQYFPEVIIFESNVNLGFGQGNNKGIRYALDNSADYVFLLNQDAWIEPDTIAELVRIQKENPAYGILSPMNLTAEKNSILNGFIEYIVDYNNTDCKLVDDLYFNRLRDIYDIKSVNAASWLLSRGILETVGGFDPIFFHYGEDDNYLQRSHYHDFKVGICPKVSLVHDAEVSNQFNQNIREGANKRNLLLICADINNNLTPDRYIKFLVIKLLKKTFTIKFKTLNQYYTELKYLLSVRNEINYSRKTNIVKGENWL